MDSVVVFVFTRGAVIGGGQTVSGPAEAADDDGNGERKITSGFEDAAALGEGVYRVRDVFEGVGMDNQIEAVIRKWEMVHVHFGIGDEEVTREPPEMTGQISCFVDFQ